MWDYEKLSLKYTSKQLDKLRGHVAIMQTCPVCNNVFDAQSYVFRPTAIYPTVRATCSDTCKRTFGGRKNKRVVRDYVCEGCKQAFVPHPKKPHQKFCTKQCRGNILKGQPRPEVQAWVHKLVPPRGSISIEGTQWLSQFELTHTEHVIRLNHMTVRVDGFNSHTNTVYEYLGSFWHGNPAVYNADHINPVTKCTFGQLYSNTMARLDALRDSGFNVIVEWSPR